MVRQLRAILPAEYVNGSSRGDIQRLREVLPQLGFRLIKSGADWEIEERVASMSAPLIRLIPLTNWDTGRLRKNARRHLVEGPWLVDEQEAAQTSSLALKNATIEGPLAVLATIQLDLLLNPDPFPALEKLVRHQPDLMLYRIVGTEKLAHRQTVWRSLTRAAEDGLSWADQRTQGEIWGDGLSAGSPVSGFFPVQYLCAPLFAREQPLAMAFNTARGAQVIAVPKHGGWPRAQNLTGWPTGGASMPLTGPGKALYASRFSSLPERHPVTLLEDLVASGDRMLDFFTNPVYWTDSSNHIQVLDRNAAWVSFELGTTALLEMAKNWSSPESTWTAFRALTILEGLWGPNQATLRKLLDPRILKKQAISKFTNQHYQEWAEDIASNFESSLTTAFGSPLDTALGKAEDIRHLLHGARARDKNNPLRRLEVMRNVETTRIQLVRDMATFWWAAVILAPDMFCPPNIPSL